MRIGFDQPVRVLPPACRRDAAEPDTDAADRRAVPGNPLVWLTPNGTPSSTRGLPGGQQAGASADGQDGAGADLPAAAHNGPASRTSDPSVFAAGDGDRPAESGLVCRHHLHSDAARLLVFGCGNGLVDAQ